VGVGTTVAAQVPARFPRAPGGQHHPAHLFFRTTRTCVAPNLGENIGQQILQKAMRPDSLQPKTTVFPQVFLHFLFRSVGSAGAR
jgi:hypothetical protein